MPTLIVGVLVVAVSTAGFALSMFGRRPLPQPATTVATAAPVPVTPARDGAAPRRRRAAATTAAGVGDREVPRLQVDVPASVRIRSAFLLALGVIAAAAAVGVVLSIVVVGFFTLIG
ncbi:hypothetical protein [Dermatobacter hominis]|uniref:hypothetical protein n=1 Tax=Dermatobacter hominis TaxID=2884263 RepID=UPI001D1132E8|nr:hypothetical protein [Dermatobacter hominis]UDY34867.1 hypothetical protein LH044_16190 [Dermatobacter hominis]